MESIACSSPCSPTTTDAVRYESLTEADWRALLQYLQRCAWSLFNRPGHEVPLGEFEDAGMEALASPWRRPRFPTRPPGWALRAILSTSICSGGFAAISNGVSLSQGRPGNHRPRC